MPPPPPPPPPPRPPPQPPPPPCGNRSLSLSSSHPAGTNARPARPALTRAAAAVAAAAAGFAAAHERLSPLHMAVAPLAAAPLAPSGRCAWAPGRPPRLPSRTAGAPAWQERAVAAAASQLGRTPGPPRASPRPPMSRRASSSPLLPLSHQLPRVAGSPVRCREATARADRAVAERERTAAAPDARAGPGSAGRVLGGGGAEVASSSRSERGRTGARRAAPRPPPPRRPSRPSLARPRAPRTPGAPARAPTRRALGRPRRAAQVRIEAYSARPPCWRRRARAATGAGSAARSMGDDGARHARSPREAPGCSDGSESLPCACFTWMSNNRRL